VIFYFIVKLQAILLIPFFVLVLLIIYKFKYNLPFKLLITDICISISLSYFCFLISLVILSPLFYLTSKIFFDLNYNYIFAHLIAGILQILLSVGIFKIRRFKSGMPFLRQQNCNETGLIVSIFVLIITTLYYAFPKPNALFFILVLTSILLCLIIIAWWKHSLKKSYWETVHKNQIAALETELMNLKKDNDNLSKIIHKDNKLIPAMVLSVKELLAISAQSEIPEINLQGQTLLKELENISRERKGILTATEQHIYELPKSNLMRLDSLISYLYQKCALYGIQFKAHFNIETNYLMKFINEQELDTLIADLIENAIYATKNQKNKQILFSIDTKNNICFIDIYDTGMPFNSNIIQKLGKQKATSHANDGGSGIGLFNTLGICKKYNFSFCIDESPKLENYTKKISVIFDENNQFMYNGIHMIAC